MTGLHSQTDPAARKPPDPATKPIDVEQAAADAHRRKVLLIGAVTAALLLAVMAWVATLLVEQQRIERCLASRRTDCFRIDAPQPAGIRVPVR